MQNIFSNTETKRRTASPVKKMGNWMGVKKTSSSTIARQAKTEMKKMGDWVKPKHSPPATAKQTKTVVKKMGDWMGVKKVPLSASAKQTKTVVKKLGDWMGVKPKHQKTDIEKIREWMAADPETMVEKICKIIREPGISKSARARMIVSMTTRRSMYRYATGWLWESYRPTMWYTAWKYAVGIGGALALVAAMGGSWLFLLGLLAKLGSTFLPTNLYKILEATGIKTGTGITISQITRYAKKSKRIRHILNRKVPTLYINNALKRLGVDPLNIKWEDLGQTIISNGISLGVYTATGNPMGFLTSTAFKVGMTVAGQAVVAGSRVALRLKKRTFGGRVRGSRVPPSATGSRRQASTRHVAGVEEEDVEEEDVYKTRKRKPVQASPADISNALSVAEKLVEGGDAMVDTVSRAILDGPRSNSVAEDIGNKIEAIRPKGKNPGTKIRTAFSSPPPPRRTEMPREFIRTLSENRNLAFAGVVGGSMVALAISGGSPLALVEIMKQQASIHGEAAVERLSQSSLITGLIDSATSGSESASKTFLGKQSLKIAQKSAVKFLLDKVGATKLIRAISSSITRGQIEELNSISAAINREKDQSVLTGLYDRFIGALTGGYVSADSLSKMNLKELKQVYKNLKPDDKRTFTTSRELKKIIMVEQRDRLNKINKVVRDTVGATLKTVAVSVVHKNMKETATNLIEKIDVQKGLIKRDESMRDAEIRAKDERLERRIRAKDESARAADKIAFDKIKKLELKRLEHIEVTKRLEIRKLTRQLKESAIQETLYRREGLVIVDQDGISHPIPPDEILIPEPLKKALDWEYTPLGQAAIKEAAKSTLSYTPAGWIQGVLHNINIGLTTAETVKNIAKVTEVLVRLEQGEAPLGIETYAGGLDEILSARVPEFGDIIDNIIKTDRVVAYDTVLRVMRDSLLEGWDKKRISYEIGKEIFMGSGEGIGIDVTEMYGAKFLEKIGNHLGGISSS